MAENSQAALEALTDFEPDVLLLDIGLPGMNGHDLARRIRQQPRFRNVVLVAQTGWGQEEDRQRSRAAGFDYHLVKPVSLEQIEEILRAVPEK
jgi:CheY-like chemotaxis protein